MSREIPFEPDLICDLCGAVGGYDFMGDCICPACAKSSEALLVHDPLQPAPEARKTASGTPVLSPSAAPCEKQSNPNHRDEAG